MNGLESPGTLRRARRRKSLARLEASSRETEKALSRARSLGFVSLRMLTSCLVGPRSTASAARFDGAGRRGGGRPHTLSAEVLANCFMRIAEELEAVIEAVESVPA